MTNDTASIREVYTLVEGLRSDMTQSMKGIALDMKEMKNAFDQLEAGRLTRLESKIAYMDGKMFYIPIIITLIANIAYLLFTRFIK